MLVCFSPSSRMEKSEFTCLWGKPPLSPTSVSLFIIAELYKGDFIWVFSWGFRCWCPSDGGPWGTNGCELPWCQQRLCYCYLETTKYNPWSSSDRLFCGQVYAEEIAFDSSIFQINYQCSKDSFWIWCRFYFLWQVSMILFKFYFNGIYGLL